ncbi:MAG: cell surface protein [Deltaproteobacteria bacterium]|nr:cell surface protein [Deltaproteobacteria bacterium]
MTAACTTDGDAGPCDPFADRVISLAAGEGAGFGAENLPGIVLGAPTGGGLDRGGTDVLSLGAGGTIVVALDGEGIPDGPGPDLLVFENAFLAGGNPEQPYAEPAAVAVSDDGLTWSEFPCRSEAYPYTGCAGWHPVLAAPGNDIDPTDPDTAGGDAFDLADVGLARATFVRIRDLRLGLPAPPSAGFDLDALAAVHACPE